MKRNKSESHVHREVKGVAERKRQSMYVHVHHHVWLTVSEQKSSYISSMQQITKLNIIHF
jgi:hypothetical protein